MKPRNLQQSEDQSDRRVVGRQNPDRSALVEASGTDPGEAFRPPTHEGIGQAEAGEHDEQVDAGRALRQQPVESEQWTIGHLVRVEPESPDVQAEHAENCERPEHVNEVQADLLPGERRLGWGYDGHVSIPPLVVSVIASAGIASAPFTDRRRSRAGDPRRKESAGRQGATITHGSKRSVNKYMVEFEATVCV